MISAATPDFQAKPAATAVADRMEAPKATSSTQSALRTRDTPKTASTSSISVSRESAASITAW